MESADYIGIAIAYDGSLVRLEDGTWEYAKYKTKVTCVRPWCSKSDLEDEVYECLGVDRNAYHIKMQFLYGQASQAVEPVEIRREKDVRTFVSEVRHAPIRPLLYVELIPISPHLSFGEQENIAYKVTDGLKSGTNHLSYTSPSILPSNSHYDTQVSEHQNNEFYMGQMHFNVHEAADIGGNQSVAFSKQYEKLHNMDNCANKNIEDDNNGFCDAGCEDTADDNNVQVGNFAHDGTSIGIHHPHSTIGGASSSSHPTRTIDMAPFSLSDLSKIVINVGDIFNNKEELKTKVSLLCIGANKEFKVKRSTKDRYEIACLDDHCPWFLRATKTKGAGIFIVKAFFKDHKCNVEIAHRQHNQATSRIIGELIKSKFEGIARVYTPAEIQADLHEKFGVKLSYFKAWKGRECALDSVRGTFEESFHLLPIYCYQLEFMNPGTLTRIKTDESNCFEYLFVAFGPSIRGFVSHIRRVLAVDGTVLKGKYKGTMYIASAMDGNEQIYPLAFGIGDGENESAYKWFFQNLKDAIGDLPDLVFVTDRHKAIESAIRIVFPNAYHVLCIYHISKNLKANGHAKHEGVLMHFYMAAKAYLIEEFEYHMVNLEKLDMDAAQYVRGCDPARWARSHFKGRRYNIMTTNIAECMNAILRDSREMPLIPLLNCILNKMQKWFFERRTAGELLDKPVTNWMEDQLKLRDLESLRLRVRPINKREYVVEGGILKGIVNLDAKKCSCSIFEIDQYPCDHAMAACRERMITPYSMCSHYYTTDAYRAAYMESIYPVRDRKQWHAPEDVSSYIVLPPTYARRSAGRPRKLRIPSQGEDIVARRCSKCHGPSILVPSRLT